MSGIQRKSIQAMQAFQETPLVVRLARGDIVPDPTNRKVRDQATLEGIAASMRPPGRQLQPILAWLPPGSAKHQIILGEGRWLAAGINEELLGTEQMLDCVILEDITPGQIKAMQIVENLQRQDPSEMQFAEAFRALLDTGECKSNKEVGEWTGVSEATVSVYLRVLDGPAEIVELVKTGVATMDTARSVVMVAETNPEKAAELVQKGKAEGKLKRDEVRAAHAVEKAKSKAPSKGERATAPPEPAPAGPVTIVRPAAAAPAANAAPASRDAAPVDESAVAKSDKVDKALIAVPATSILVNVFGTSDDTEAFHANVSKHGQATLAGDVVHSDPARAWIRFGHGTSDDQLMSVLCIDLEIVKIIRRD